MTTDRDSDSGNAVDSIDNQPVVVEHAGILGDQDGVKHIVLVDHSGYAEVRTVEDDRWGEDWRDY